MKKNYVTKLNIFALAFFALVKLSGQQSYTFTPCGATGNTGPSQTQVNNTYSTTNLNGMVTTTTNGIQTWTVPYTGNFRIEARGARGGSNGGFGASMAGDFALIGGEVLHILVGQAGITGTLGPGGGGGGSYVVRTPYNTTVAILVIAGGGSGAGNYPFNPGVITTSGGNGGGAGGTNGNGGTGGTRGAGGGGFLTNGGPCTANVNYASPGQAFINGGLGGAPTNNCNFTGAGGFGGGSSHGGNCIPNGGAGGGFSGGGGSSNNASGGGGSLNAGTNQTNTANANAGDGSVIITELCSVRIYASGANSVNPVLCSGNSVTLTTDAVSNYSWSNGNTTSSVIVVSPTVTTAYSVQATSSLACTSVGSITVTVNGGVPVLSVSNPSDNICLGQTATLTASGAINYTWTGGVVNGQTFTPNSTMAYSVSGDNACGTATAVTSITVTPLAVSALASPTIVCEGLPATLSASSAVNGYTWEPGTITTASTLVVPLVNTVYTVTASDGICSGTSTLEVQTKTTPTISVVATSSNICEQESVTLTASGAGSGGTYTWSPGGATTTSIMVSPSTSSLYVVNGTNSVSCESSAQQVVIVQPGPPMQVTASNTLVCLGSSVTLSASGAVTYTWTGGPTSMPYVISPTANSVYTVVGSHNTNSCVSTRTIGTTVIQPNVTVSGSVAICAGESATLTASGANTYTWAGFIGTNTGSQVVTPAANSTFTLNATTQVTSPAFINCKSSHTTYVAVNANPSISVSLTKTVICRGETNTLTASGANTYTWSNSAGVGAEVIISPTISAIYSVAATDANGCVGSHIFPVSVASCNNIAENGAKLQNISIFPNPNNGTFTIKVDVSIELKLMNNLGQEIRNINLNETNHFTTDLNNLSNGIYFLVGENENGKVNQKIVVNK